MSGQKQGEQVSAAQAVEQAQKQSEQAFNQAKDAQRKASEEQRDTAQAQRNLQEAQKDLTKAQAQVQKEGKEAQQAQQQAQQQTEQAEQTAAHAQQNALEAQRQQQAELARQAQQQAQQQTEQAQQQAQASSAPSPATQAQGEQLIVGEVLTVNDREVLVSSRGEPQIRLQVQPGTVITVDGRTARAADIEEGSQVRASYNTQAGEPTATRIEVTTSRQPAMPAVPESGQSAPGAQPERLPQN
ncbi:hypothetical protein [Hyalangium minutum]|uniref:TolA protein n=1 Tax=Hyalangium minutum TaxID=394096 RepID=A0A085WU64_9BACT|nr:hypothetical protein [Hyalangium minutum]KFE71227.1 hypothetical protein DB31_3357 [Hyalangium minutum]